MFQAATTGNPLKGDVLGGFPSKSPLTRLAPPPTPRMYPSSCRIRNVRSPGLLTTKVPVKAA